MTTEANLQTVQAVFGAFGAGDMPALLDLLTDDVEWVMPAAAGVPHYGQRQGKAGAREFFELLGAAAEFTAFDIHDLVASGDKVVALGHEVFRVRATGNVVEQDFALAFTVRDGKVARCHGYEDSAAVAAGFAS